MQRIHIVLTINDKTNLPLSEVIGQIEDATKRMGLDVKIGSIQTYDEPNYGSVGTLEG